MSAALDSSTLESILNRISTSDFRNFLGCSGLVWCGLVWSGSDACVDLIRKDITKYKVYTSASEMVVSRLRVHTKAYAHTLASCTLHEWDVSCLRFK